MILVRDFKLLNYQFVTIYNVVAAHLHRPFLPGRRSARARRPPDQDLRRTSRSRQCCRCRAQRR
jgi:hypothetical protein